MKFYNLRFVFLSFILSFPLGAAGSLQVTETEKAISIRRGDLMVLTYHKAEVPPPEKARPHLQEEWIYSSAMCSKWGAGDRHSSC